MDSNRCVTNLSFVSNVRADTVGELGNAGVSKEKRELEVLVNL